MNIDVMELRNEIINAQQTGKMSERLGQMIIESAKGILKTFRHNGLVEDMAQDTVVQVIINIKLFDMTQCPLAYVQAIAKHCLWQHLRKLKAEHKIALAHHHGETRNTGQQRGLRKGIGSKPVTYNGETKMIDEWAKQFGLSRSCLWRRLNKLHLDFEEAVTRPLRSNAAQG